MAGIRSKNTRPELVVRKTLHALGYRFRLHRKDLPGKPDIVLPKWKTVIFVHGCFWHGHENCRLYRLPKSRPGFWAEKIAKNKARDDKIQAAYLETGWKSVVIWECALKGPSALPELELSSKLSASIQSFDAVKSIRGHHA